MKYRLIQQAFGTSHVIEICTIDTEDRVSDFCLIDKHGFLFSIKNKHYLIMVEKNGKIISPFLGKIGILGEGYGYDPLLSYPISICYEPNYDLVYLIENYGTMIKKIHFNPVYTENALGKASTYQYRKIFKNLLIPQAEIKSCIHKKALAFTHNLYNKCFKTDGNVCTILFGSGNCGFSICSKVKCSDLSNPIGISYFKTSYYICDTFNHCIRELSDDVDNRSEICVGNPCKEGDKEGCGTKAELSFPRLLKIKNNFAYFVDNKGVKGFDLSNKEVYFMKEETNYSFVDLDDKKNLYILEELNA